MNNLTTDKEIVNFYDSPEEFCTDISNNPGILDKARRVFNGHNGDSKWVNNQTPTKSLENLNFGSTQYLARAEKLIEQLNEEQIFNYGELELESSIAGFMPDVPEYLMGQPENMLEYVQTESMSTSTPIRFYLDLTISAGVTSNYLTDRGVALLGLVMALKKIRPVELYCVAISYPRGNYKIKASGGVFRVETNPIDLARATFMLADPGFIRNLGFGLMMNLSDTTMLGIGWAYDLYNNTDKYEAAFRELLNMDERDIFITGTRLFDTQAQRDPVNWIKAQLKKYSEL